MHQRLSVPIVEQLWVRVSDADLVRGSNKLFKCRGDFHGADHSQQPHCPGSLLVLASLL